MTDTPRDQISEPALSVEHPVFFCGIGGSGMLPLAQILTQSGYQVSGSDRSYDQGRTPRKFAWLQDNGMRLFRQDGSGISSSEQVLIASAAIEETVPEVVRARELGCLRLSRAEALASLFNRADHSFAIGGTSGKSTVTGMVGTILDKVGLNPTIMNGAVMKDFVTPDTPFASARAGDPNMFVSEVDESDGSIALFRPNVATLLNISRDHKTIEELRILFSDFVSDAGTAVINFDNENSRFLAGRAREVVSFGVNWTDADITVDLDSIDQNRLGIRAAVIDNREQQIFPLILPLPGLHNLSNALAAIASASAAGISVRNSVYALRDYRGLARRFDVIGTSPNGITVVDDFGHNPEKCAATLRTLKAHPGRVIAFFQPHGFGPLRQMGAELAEAFAEELDDGDHTIMCDPVYFGGTVDRSEGTERIVDLITQAGGQAEHIADRAACGDRMVEIAQPGDRIVIMGARDDTLSDFARSIFARLS